MSAPRRSQIVSLLHAVWLALLLTTPAIADPELNGGRPVVPTPPGGGPGISFAPEDLNLAGKPGGSAVDAHLAQLEAQELAAEKIVEKALRDGDIGGDDVLIHAQEEAHDISVDVAENGDIYVAVNSGWASAGMPRLEVRVFRSQDGGDTWQAWGELIDPVTEYFEPHILVAEGTANRCFLAYTRSVGTAHTVCVAYSDLSLPVGDFSTENVVMESPTRSYYIADICTDAASWDSYFLYLVATKTEADGTDICFARSVDQGTTFESSYEIGTISSTSANYREPSVAYGFGGYVHAAWNIASEDGSFDTGLRYRRAASYANGGLSAWDPIQFLTSTANDISESGALIDASKTDGQVVIGYRYYELGLPISIGYLGSTDQGASFPVSHVNIDELDFLKNLEWQPSTGNWIVAGNTGISGAVQRSAGSDITSWGSPEVFTTPVPYPPRVNGVAMAIDPSRTDRLAFAWDEEPDDSSLFPVMFDAEWRRDPGYPNLEEGFPLDLYHAPVSDPAVVDLDGDGDLEIVFGDAAGTIQAFHHDGSYVDGWPAQVGGMLSDGPVAIGDMRGNGDMIVVAGTTDGRAYAFEANAAPVPGWPFDTTETANCYVSIGALGGPYPRMAAVCAGTRLYFVNNNGSNHHGIWWSWPGRTFNAPVAIGDVDGDGVAEAVGAVSDRVFAVHATEPTGVMGATTPTDVSDAVTLGDLDLDGDVEIVVPTAGGELYAYQGDGSLMAGTWPFVSTTGSALSSAAIGQMLGSFEPEMVFAARNWNVHAVYHNGNEGIGYPVQTAGWAIYGAPIIGLVDGSTSTDPVIGARGARGWAWNNFGQLIPGWPKGFDANVYEAPAMGDLDLDGSSEIVFLTDTQLIVIDINQPDVPADRSWKMYGHDPQRSGCSDCPEDVITGVSGDAEMDGVTRVRFAQPSPNPIAGQATFSFALPVRAQVRLEVFDLRGARVATVLRGEVDPGEHVVGWGGRADGGRHLASGQYLARLQVRGPGVENELVRKVTLLR